MSTRYLHFIVFPFIYDHNKAVIHFSSGNRRIRCMGEDIFVILNGSLGWDINHSVCRDGFYRADIDGDELGRVRVTKRRVWNAGTLGAYRGSSGDCGNFKVKYLPIVIWECDFKKLCLSYMSLTIARSYWVLSREKLEDFVGTRFFVPAMQGISLCNRNPHFGIIVSNHACDEMS